MGCCFSSRKDSAPQKHPHSSVRAQLPGSDTCHSRVSNSRAPPPTSIEEESVKEVLSETPTPKPAITKFEEKEEKKTPKPVFQKIEEEKKIEKAPVITVPEEISEVSEIYSVSESISTTTITERRDDDDDGEVRQRVIDRSPAKFPRNRSFSGDISGRRERMVVGRSPAKRPEPSPGRRNDGGVRSANIREGSQTKVRRGLGTDNSHRRDSGESSGRRSRSPATRYDGGGSTRSALLGRIPSTRKTGRSPSRVPVVPPESSRKMEENKEEKWSPPTNESLENPLVSLECFIFL